MHCHICCESSVMWRACAQIDHVLADIPNCLSLSLPPSLSPSAFPFQLYPLLWRSTNSRLWVWSITLFSISYSRPEKGPEHFFWMGSPLEYPNALVSQSWSGSHFCHHSSYFYHYSQGIKYIHANYSYMAGICLVLAWSTDLLDADTGI